MKKFQYLVEKVSGYCSCGYKEGDLFYSDGMNTPSQKFCGGAYMALFPIQVALNSGAKFYFETNPNSKGALSCPDNGNVIFRITLISGDKKDE